MAYVGNVPAVAYTNTVKDTFSGDGSTVAFTLSLPTTTNNVRVVVENVIQDPTVAYGVSGTTLTFTSAPPSGTNNIYVVHLGPAVQTVQPPTELSGNFTLTGKLSVDSSGTAIEIDDAGSTFGEIGSSSSSLFVGTTDTGVLFYDAGDSILPFNPGTGTRDNAIDLGRTTDRFKDLYLSGGVYLGGTGSANLLDDYEEGTWTPRVKGDGNDNAFTLSAGQGSYVKIGNLVTVNFVANATSVNGASGALQVVDLPFTISDVMGATGIEANGVGAYWATWATAINHLTYAAENATTLLYVYGTTAGTQTNISSLTAAHMGNSGSIRGSITYRTT